MESGSMFSEMKEAGSHLPDMIEKLLENGWITINHHDNWIKKEWADSPDAGHLGFDTHAAYARIKNPILLREAMATLVDFLKEDTTEGSYYYSWQANIAVAFQDECNNWREKNNRETIPAKAFHEISNNAAKYFLNLLIK